MMKAMSAPPHIITKGEYTTAVSQTVSFGKEDWRLAPVLIAWWARSVIVAVNLDNEFADIEYP
jgi:hypothetical protein